MMKIAVVTRYFPSSAEPSQGRSAYNTILALGDTAEVRVFYPNAFYPSGLRPRSRTYRQLDPDYRVPPIDVTYYNCPALPLISRPINGWMAARVLLPDIRAFSPDLLFGYFIYPDCFAALQIARSLGVPIVAESIGSDINRVSDWVSARHTRRVLRESDYVVTVSGDLRRKAIAWGAAAARTRAIVNGCDLSVFHVREQRMAREALNIDPALETVVYVGRTDVRKGLCELVEAAAALHPRRHNLQFYLVGDGPDRSIVEETIRAHQAKAYVHLVPGCGFDEVALWMASANLVTLPSYMEGCPNVVLESLACGRPVVATSVGGIPELLNQECGRLVPPRDSAGLAEAIDSVLDRSWDPHSISAHWSRSWKTVAAELLEVFESVLANSCKASCVNESA